MTPQQTWHHLLLPLPVPGGVGASPGPLVVPAPRPTSENAGPAQPVRRGVPVLLTVLTVLTVLIVVAIVVTAVAAGVLELGPAGASSPFP